MLIPEHRCESMPKSGIAIYCEDIDVKAEDRCWTIAFMREATESDLEESSILEEVGEEIWRMEAEINFCPYCGKRLTASNASQEKESNSNMFGEFRLLDQEAWNLRVR